MLRVANRSRWSGASTSVLGEARRVASWLATAPEALELEGVFVDAQQLTSSRGLLPGWSLDGIQQPEGMSTD